MNPLPDVPIQAWIQSTQERFYKATEPLWDALSFETAARPVEANIPTDFPLPGGEDQWRQAEQDRIEQEKRIQQQREEEARQQEEAARQQQLSQQADQQIQALGIPTPDSIAQQFAQLANRDDASTAGTFDQMGAGIPSQEEPRPPIQRDYAPLDESGNVPLEARGPFHGRLIVNNADEGIDLTGLDSYKGPLGPSAESAGTTAMSATETQPDNTSSGIWPDLGGMARGAAEGLGRGMTALGEGAANAIQGAGEALGRVAEYEKPEFMRPETAHGREFNEGGLLGQIGAVEASLIPSLASLPGAAGRTVDEVLGTSTLGELAPAIKDIPIIGEMLAQAKPLEVAANIVPLPGKAGRVVDVLQGGAPNVAGMLRPESVPYGTGVAGAIERGVGAVGEGLRRGGQSLGEEAARQAMGAVPTPGMAQAGEESIWRGARGASERAVEEAAPTAEPTRFQTAKGSTYDLHEDGTTTRNKAARTDVGHEGDSGLKPKSEATYFLTPERASALGPPEGPSRIIDHGDGTLSLATRNADGRWGIAPSARNIPYSKTPEAGLHPLEVWGREEVNGLPGYKDTHFGNEITSVAGKTAPAEPINLPNSDVTAAAQKAEAAAAETEAARAASSAAQARAQRRLAGGAGQPPSPPPAPPGEQPSRWWDDYQKVDAAAKIREAGYTGKDPVPADVKQVFNMFQNSKFQMTDKYAMTAAAKGYFERQLKRKLTVNEDAWLQSRLYEGHADAGYAKTQRELQPALSKLNSTEQREFSRYLEQMDNVDVGATRDASERAFPGGAEALTEQEVRDGFRGYLGPESYDRIEKAAESFYTLRDEMRARAVDAGYWSQKQADFLMENFPHYIPTRILSKMDESQIKNLPIGSRMFSVGDDGIRALSAEGTTAIRQDPVHSLVDMVFRMEELAGRNKVMRAVAKQADEPGMYNMVRRLEKGQKAPKGFKEMSVFEDGVHQKLAVVEPWAKSLELADTPMNALMAAGLWASTAPLRLGATAARPAFIFTNAINDAALSLSRFATSSKNPVEAIRSVHDLYRGYRMSFGEYPAASRAGIGAFVGGGTEAVREDPNDPNYWQKIGAGAAVGAGVAAGGFRANAEDRALVQQMREAGGSIGMQTRFQKSADIVRQLKGEHVWVRTIEKPTDILDALKQYGGAASDIAGMAWTRPLNYVGEGIEKAPRYAAYARAIRQGASPEEGAMAARRITADFAAGGAFSKQLNRMVPFFNATMQASTEGADAVRKNPAKWAALMSTIVGGIVMTDIYNRTVAPDEYKDVTKFTKNTGMVILSDQPAEGDGKRGLVYIPLRGVIGSLVPLTHAVLSAYYGDDPRTWRQMAVDTGVATFNQMSPINADVGGVMGSMAPPMARLAYELQSNYNSFTDAPIVSKAQEGLPVSEQYNDQTSQIARHLSRSTLPVVGGTSPMYIDYATKGFSPGPGEALLGAADLMIRATGNELPSTGRNVEPGARDRPIVGGIAGRVLRTVGSERQNQAYDEADRIVARNEQNIIAMLENSSVYQNSTPDRQKQMLRSAKLALVEQSREMANVPDFQKNKDLGLPSRYYGVAPGSRLEDEITTALNTPTRQRTSYQTQLYYQYKQLVNKAYKPAAKSDAAETAAFRQQIGRMVT